MIEEIRVKARAATMEEAEREMFLLIDHARSAGLLEGVIADGGGVYHDPYFSRPELTRKPGDEEDVWSSLGMPYSGRLSFVFNPGVVKGGLHEYGHIVLKQEIAEPGESGSKGGWRKVAEADLARLEEVTEAVIVLDRRIPVTREHSWEGTPSYEQAIAEENAEATTDEVLDSIRRLSNLADLNVTQDGTDWRVEAELRPARDGGVAEYVGSSRETLREAALDVYGACGQPVLHYDTKPPQGTAVSGNTAVWSDG